MEITQNRNQNQKWNWRDYVSIFVLHVEQKVEEWRGSLEEGQGLGRVF